MSSSLNEVYQQWLEQHQRLQKGIHRSTESPAKKQARIGRARTDYDFFVRTYFPDVARCPCAKFHIAAARYIAQHNNARAVFEWARGHAKSTHMGVLIPLWLKIQQQRQFHTLVLVGKSEESAKRLLSDLQAQLQFNELYTADFGGQIGRGSWAEGEFTTADGCHFVALGRGQSPRGLKHNSRRPDYIVIDDIDDDELCRNPTRVQRTMRWIQTALFFSMDAGRGRFILVGNRIAKDSIIAQFADNPNYHHTQVNMLDKRGRPSWPENFTMSEINQLRREVGERQFQQEAMNNPTPDEGSIFSRRHLRFGPMLPLQHYRQLVCYTDPSFRSSATADFKATVLVGVTREGHFHVLQAHAEQTSVSHMVEWHYDIVDYVGGRAPVLFYMEAGFIQDLLLDEFRKEGDQRGHHVPIIADHRRKPDKFARIEAMQPLFERGLVVLAQEQERSPGMQVLIDQLLAFDRGSRQHDDAPDALEGAIWLLSQRTRTNSTRFVSIPRKKRLY